ncbi:MAG TPA: hypothetical protein DDZ91_09295 [Firmicutes bacterium]|jgi:hypothetical protein|nr:hypothetical protein [Bacillota bacterium]
MLKKMITFILSLVMVFLTAWAVQAQGVIKFSADLSGSVETNYLQKNTCPVNPGYLVGIEFFQQKQEETLLGAGVEYQLLRYAENLDEEFGFIPVYGLIRLHFSPFARSKPYLIGKLGYSFFRVEEPDNDFDYKGGLYYGGGIGLTLSNNVQFEADYTVHNGEKRLRNFLFPYRYTKVSLALGLLF